MSDPRTPEERVMDAAWGRLEAPETRAARLATTLPFDHIDPRGPDLLIGVAAWMDRKDAESGNPRHDVQEDLRRWAAVMYEVHAALDRLERTEP